jgi:hypothetical protein
LPEGSAEEAAQSGRYEAGRWGSRDVEITAVRLLDSSGQDRRVFAPGEKVTVAMSVRAAQPVTDFVFGVGLFSSAGVNIYGTNTGIEEIEPRRLSGDGEVRFVLDELRLVEGTYLLDLAAHRDDGTPYDYQRGLYSFSVKSRLGDTGLYRPAHRWEFDGGIEMDVPPPRDELDLGNDPAS